MKLSIIIVNYNVKYFLGQLLQSIEASSVSFEYEIIVVDNNSTDGSVPFVKANFPEVIVLESSDNLGFSGGTNLGARQAKGDHILILNPDTILSEDTLQVCVKYLEDNPGVGALGCRMIDGSGRYLPESKRGLPSPRVALFKILGLSALFPRSEYFNYYYMGHLSESEVGSIDVLTGAFMMVPRHVLEEVDYLDEDYFMYGEDVDISYRIGQAGYDIVYFPDTTILHFKGESTQKESADYISRFYGAMQIFADKHYSSSRGRVLKLSLQLGIWLSAGMAFLSQIMKKIGLAAVEWFAISCVLKLFSLAWATYYFGDPDYYDRSLINVNIVLYASVWILFLLISGAYDYPRHAQRLLKGIVSGWMGITIIYGLLGSALRSSRSLIVFGGLLAFGVTFLLRTLLFSFRKGGWSNRPVRYVIVGNQDQVVSVQRYLKPKNKMLHYVGYILPDIEDFSTEDNSALGKMEDLDQIVRFHRVQEIIFCASIVPSGEIMQWMTSLGTQYRYKIAPSQAGGIIGSHSKKSSGELYTMDVQYNVAEPHLRRNKRLMDLVVAGFIMMVLPIFVWFVRDKKALISNLMGVLKGDLTWVGYANTQAGTVLPPLRPSVLFPPVTVLREDAQQAILDGDYFYAKDYSVWKDLSLLFNNLANLGKKST